MGRSLPNLSNFKIKMISFEKTKLKNNLKKLEFFFTKQINNLF